MGYFSKKLLLNGSYLMLIQFSVENFRSIKEEQTFSLVKDSPSELPHNYFSSGAPNVPELLHTAVIYGANASGKSNVLKAMQCLSNLVEDSFNKKLDGGIPVEPFLLDDEWAIKPTTFSVSFVVNLSTDKESIKMARCDYGVVTTKEKILEEWLSVYPNGREQAWFHRIYKEEKHDYDWKFSSHMKGRVSVWKENTRKDQLFLSTAVHLNSEQFRPIYDWFVEKMSVNKVEGDNFSKDICANHSGLRELIVSLMQQADIDVEGVFIQTEENTLEKIPKSIPDSLKKDLLNEFPEIEKAFFIHADNDGNKVLFELAEESKGTQKLFSYAAYILEALAFKRVLVVDELNESLHPDLVRYLVQIFNSEINQKNDSQLIFTTHETSVLRKDLLRRDQIWFCEKDKNKATLLYPLTDFSPLKDRTDVEEGYLSGRYGGKPIVKKFSIPDYLKQGNKGKD